MAGPSTVHGDNNIWELSLYELHRKPHEMVTDSTVVAVSPRALRSELMCPICLDMMKNPLTTKECLHRFCQECIITALRSGNKECPTCRKKLISKRSLRSDPNFDALINKIYPDRDELNTEAEKFTPRRAQLPTKRKRKAPDSRPGSESPPLEEKRAKTASPEEEIDPHTSHATPEPAPPSYSQPTAEEIELQVRPHPLDTSVAEQPIRNLQTSLMATVAHVVKYLSVYPYIMDQLEGMPPNFDSHEHMYTLYIQLGEEEQYLLLPNGTTVKQICENYWTPGEKLKLYFAMKDRTRQQN